MSTTQFIIDKSTDNGRIPDVTRLDLAKWFRRLDYKTGVEVGVAEGEYSKIICELNPQLKLYGVDPYLSYDGYGDYKREATFKRLYDESHNRLNPYVKRGRYEFIEKMSMDAVKDFQDNSLDFVYLDGNHQDPYITQDITEWMKKVKPGGMLAGHDYARIKRVKWGVKEAVDKYAKDNNLKLFILGLDATTDYLVRDGSRTWLMLKPL